MIDYSGLELITGPTAAIVTAAEFKTFARLSQDADISVISSATAAAETWCNRKFLKQKWRLPIYNQPAFIELPFGYINSVDSIKMIDEDKAETEETEDTTYIVKTGENGHVKLKSTATWTTLTYFWRMQIDFFVGHDDISSIKEPERSNLKNAILNIATRMYFNRGVNVEISKEPEIRFLLQPFIRHIAA